MIKLNVYERFQLSLARMNAINLPEALYDKLFQHFCDNGEMPYGTATAKDGDPYQWILEHTK